MKKFPLILIGATLVVGSSAMVLTQMQSKERMERQMAALQESLQKQTAATEAAQAAEEKLRAANETFKQESEELRKRVSSGGATLASLKAEDKEAAGAPKKEGGNEGGNFMKGMAKMFTDPEMKEAMRGQQAMAINMMYADLAKELGLSAEEGKQVMEMLTDRQMALAAKSMAAMGDNPDPKAMADIGQQVNASKAEYDLQLKGLLGEDRMKKLTQYEETVGDRMQLKQIETSLSASGMALKDNQTKSLLTIMSEERQKIPPSVFSPGNTDVGAQVKAMQSGDGVDLLIKSNADMNQRVLSRARDVLSPDQMNAFEAAQKQQAAMMQMGMKMMKNMKSQ